MGEKSLAYIEEIKKKRVSGWQEEMKDSDVDKQERKMVQHIVIKHCGS